MPAYIQQLLRDQQEANEKLVLTTIHALELKDKAERAAYIAEETARIAEVAKKIAQAIAEDFAKRELELRATADFREQLLAIIGHDLRNPLQSISMAAQLLEAKGALSVTDAKLVGRVRNSAQRMSRMIAQLLEFTRTRLSGGRALDLKPTNFQELCSQVVEELEIGVHAQVRTAVEGDLTGTWDVDQLAQVLSNILGNAVDHSTPGTDVLLTAAENGGDIFVEITNQGDPIPPDVLPVIFHAFRRGQHPEHAKAGHLGLGLYIAYQAIAAHGGTLTARSAEGTTTFSIRLPRFPKTPTCGS